LDELSDFFYFSFLSFEMKSCTLLKMPELAGTTEALRTATPAKLGINWFKIGLEFSFSSD
jgi:hypothetical protein